MCCEIAMIGLRPHTERNMHHKLCQPLSENSEGLKDRTYGFKRGDSLHSRGSYRSQITEEIRRLTTNGKLTSKLRKNRKWMRSEIKIKLTKQRLQKLKEKKINQLRTKKIQRKPKLTSHKRRKANKEFDRYEASSTTDHCRNIIKSDINNERPKYTDNIRQQSTTDDSSSLTVTDFNDFWRPIWETEKKANLEAKWIHTVAEAM